EEWTGQITPTYSETYTFYTTSDDGVRLWVNGVQVINNWTDHGATVNSGTISLTAGQHYSIVLDHYNNTGGAQIKLEWQSTSQAREVVPASALSVTGQHLVTQYVVDALGRPTQVTYPAGNIDYYTYNDANHAVRLYAGWNTSTNAPTLPTQVYRED